MKWKLSLELLSHEYSLLTSRGNESIRSRFKIGPTAHGPTVTTRLFARQVPLLVFTRTMFPGTICCTHVLSLKSPPLRLKSAWLKWDDIHRLNMLCCQRQDNVTITYILQLVTGWGADWAWFNMNMPSYQYRKSHCADKTILVSSYLHNGIYYTGKMTSLYWIRPQVDLSINIQQWWSKVALPAITYGCELWQPNASYIINMELLEIA